MDRRVPLRQFGAGGILVGRQGPQWKGFSATNWDGRVLADLAYSLRDFRHCG